MILVDSFDHDVEEPRGLRGEKLDRYVLSNSKRVSIFWITETQARAVRITKWEESGQLVTDNSPGYPWMNIVSFNPDRGE